MNKSRSTLRRPCHHAGWASAAAAPLVLLAALSAQATTVVGGSDLLNAASASQLETWLGAGPIKLTNIFDKVAGNTAVDFHAAADDKGATFSVIEVTGYRGVAFDTPVLVGGYNPRSWSLGGLNGTWNMTPDDADRTAFVFNLSLSLKMAQRHDSGAENRGHFQTRDYYLLGPTFGAGYDLQVNWDLNGGDSFLYSYGADTDFGLDLARYPQRGGGTLVDLRLGQIEVFAISPAVPEPETYTLMLAGLAVVAVAKRRILSRPSARRCVDARGAAPA